MKHLRLGNTEFNLMIAHFCEKNCNVNIQEINYINNIKMRYVDWIYKTAGYYDKNIQIKNQYTLVDFTDKLSTFIEKMTNTLYNSHNVIVLDYVLDHTNHSSLNKYIPDFEKKFNMKLIPGCIGVRECIPFILNKKVLVVSPFKELIDQQITNISNIQPTLINSQFITYKFPYTFLNNGPNYDSFETLDIIKNDIKENYKDFDVAILSCGCYGSFLVEMISDEMKKDALYVGGQLPLVFGIICKRDKWAISELYNNDTTYLINGIPDIYRPDGWERIEDGCYW